MHSIRVWVQGRAFVLKFSDGVHQKSEQIFVAHRGDLHVNRRAKLTQYFTWHLMDRRRRSPVEPGFRGILQPSRRAGARSATGRGEG